MAAKIRIENISFSYNAGERNAFGALENISLDIEEGEFVCLLGPSGCGKSTLLSLLMGLNHADSGTLRLDDKVLKGPGIDRAVVFQHYSLFPWLTARRNVAFAIRQSGRKYTAAERTRKAQEYLEAVGLGDAGDKYPSELSGGMQQRVAIARALAMESDVLLMDEPFGAIDPRLRRDLQVLVQQLSKEHHKTVVFVTHDIDEAIILADRIVVMEPKRIRRIVPVTVADREDRGAADYKALHEELISLFYTPLQDAATQIGNLDSDIARQLRDTQQHIRERQSTVEEASFI